jgi:hypothetical protein
LGIRKGGIIINGKENGILKPNSVLDIHMINVNDTINFITDNNGTIGASIYYDGEKVHLKGFEID